MLFYSLFLFIAIIVPFKVDSFNYVFLSFFSLTGLMLLPSSKSILFCLLFGILFLGVLLYTQTGFLYFTNDFLLICLISLVLYSPLKYTFTNIEIKIFTSVLIVYLLLLLFFSLFPSFYDEGRYLGLLKGTNSSASVSILLIIFLWEIVKQKNWRYKIGVLYLFLFVWCYILYVFKTRTLLFATPYFLYQLYCLQGQYFKYTLFFFIVLFGSLVLFGWEQIQESLRLNEDGSLKTRTYLYEMFFKELIKNNFLQPDGFNSATLLAKYVMEDDTFSVHNDFLRYAYDWGGAIFGGFIYVVYRNFRTWNLNIILILLVVCANAFHNMLFSYMTLIPFLFILSVYASYNDMWSK